MGLCVFSLHISLVMIVSVYTLSYYHHQIGSMKYHPLFRARSWNNGMCCIFLYILLTQTSENVDIYFQHNRSRVRPGIHDTMSTHSNKSPQTAFCFVIYNLTYAWWIKLLSHSFMMTSSNGNIFRVTDPLCGEFTGPGEFPTQRPVTRSSDVFFDLGLNRRLSKQPRGWWFETQSWSLWRLCNVFLCCHFSNYHLVRPSLSTAGNFYSWASIH